MPHDLPLLTTIAAAVVSAWILGVAAQKLRLSPIVGYLTAGVVIGPYTPGFVGDTGLAMQLAEVGVILLMFGVGIHFHVEDLNQVKGIAIPGAIIQSAIATLLGVACGAVFGWPAAQGLVLGLALSVASTVVLLRGLEDHGLLDSPSGAVAVGWLIVEDILTVVVLVVLPALGGTGSDGAGPLLRAMALALAKLAALVAIVFVAGARFVPWILVQVTRLRSRELFTLTVLALALAIATGAAFLFGVSMALGAFLAGMAVGQSPVSAEASADALPLRDAFAVLFFVSVGMLFEPAFLVREPLLLLSALAIVLVGKPLAALAVVALLGYSARTALVVAAGLAQVGEFSFILGDVARQHGLLSDTVYSLIVACALVSISLNPFLFRWVGPAEAWLRRRPVLWPALNAASTRRTDQVNAQGAAAVASRTEPLAVVVGYGPVGQAVDTVLREAGLETVVVDTNMDTVAAIEAAGRLAIFGDASHEAILEKAGVRRASHLVITLPHSVNRAPLIARARQLNPRCRIVVRARYLREREELEQAGADDARFEEAEAAIALSESVLQGLGADDAAVRAAGQRVRRDVSRGSSAG
jgi:monovalent cation:H+ antiporter-2, CPA2 family